MAKKKSQVDPGAPPSSLEAEQHVLAACLLDPDRSIPAVVESGLKPDHLYRLVHKRIYEALLAMFEAGTEIDVLSLSNQLTVAGHLETIGGAAYLCELSDAVATVANVAFHAEIVIERAHRRRLIEIARDIEALALNMTEEFPAIVDRAESEIMQLRAGQDRAGLRVIDEDSDGIFERLDALAAGTIEPGITTGFTDLDGSLDGLKRSDLIILGGRPSMGKTAFALNIALQVACPEVRESGRQRPFYSVAFFSIEMSREQLYQRVLAMLSGLDLKRIITGRGLSEEDWQKLVVARTILKYAPVYIDDRADINVLDIRAMVRRIMQKIRKNSAPLGLVVVDYLQLMSGRAQSREQEIATISRGLKLLAKEINVPILALSQLNRNLESRAEPRPMLSDLRESGAIEQDADVVAFVFRESVYDSKADPNTAEVLIRKNRQGATDSLRFWFTPETGRFRSMAR